MRVHRHTLVIWCSHEALPEREWLERIVNEHDCVGLLGGAKGEANVSIRIEPILFDDGKHIRAVKSSGPEET